MGTMPYMSPEQIAGRAVDQQTDVFSFGVMLYEMATGRRPFAGQSSAELASAILRDAPPAPATCRAGLPEGLMQVITRCLEKEPDARFQSMRDLHDALQNLPRDGVTDRRSREPRPRPRMRGAPDRGRRRDPAWRGGVFGISEPTVGARGHREGARDPIHRRAAARQLLRRSEPGLLRRGDDRRAHLGPRAHEPDPGDLARFGDAVRWEQSTVGPRDRRGAGCRRHRGGLGACDPETRSGSMHS